MAMKPICRQCAKPLLAAQSIRDGICLVCRILNEDQGRADQKEANAALGRAVREAYDKHTERGASRGTVGDVFLIAELGSVALHTIEAVTRAGEGNDGRQ